MYMYVYTDENAIENTIRKSKFHLLLHKWPALRAREDCDDSAIYNYEYKCEYEYASYSCYK